MNMFIIVLIIFGIFGGYMGSMIVVTANFEKRRVSTNLVSIIVVFLPILNTILAIYYTYPEYKETFYKIFKNK